MNITWDYTALAKGYLKRPDYAREAVSEMINKMSGKAKCLSICDMGAGDGHLTIELAKRGHTVFAVEPNHAMRANGIRKTKLYPIVTWYQGVAEKTTLSDGACDAITFGSSFNVCDQMKALAEARRICKTHGHFACLWNHRDINDPIQSEIEKIIKCYISHYDYGNRRQDQTSFLKASGYLKDIVLVSGDILHTQTMEECIEAWRSHGTLYRQCHDEKMFNDIILDIKKFLKTLNQTSLMIPYTTRIWIGTFV